MGFPVVPGFLNNLSIDRPDRVIRSHNLRPACRFSPTRSFDEAQDRFIPLAAPAEMIPQFDYSHALGDKTLYVRNGGATTAVQTVGKVPANPAP